MGRYVPAEIFVSRRWIRRGKFCVLIELCTRFTFVGCIEPIWASAVRSTAAAGEGENWREGKGEGKGAGGRVRVARIRRAEPEGKEADFYANICETLCHGKTTHTRGMNTRRRRGFHISSKVRREQGTTTFLAGHLVPNSAGATPRISH